MEVNEFNKKFEEKLKEYQKHYDVDSLINPNDVALLHTVIRNDLLIERFQLKELEAASNIDFDSDSNIMELKKFGDLLKDRIRINMELQRTLGIDRKSRRADDTTSPKEYIQFLKQEANAYLEKRLRSLYCPNCNIQLARFNITQTFSEYSLEVRCHQCNNVITDHRDQLSRFHDIEDSEWREEFPGEVVQPGTITKEDPVDYEAGDEITLVAEED